MHGGRAAYLRNLDIVTDAECVVAFWDGSSKGTAMTVGLAQRLWKDVEVFTAGAPS